MRILSARKQWPSGAAAIGNPALLLLPYERSIIIIITTIVRLLAETPE